MTTPERRWPSLLTVAQAAQMLGRNPQTVLDLLHKGVLRGRKSAGGSFVLLRDQVLVDAERHRLDVAAGYRERRRNRP